MVDCNYCYWVSGHNLVVHSSFVDCCSKACTLVAVYCIVLVFYYLGTMYPENRDVMAAVFLHSAAEWLNLPHSWHVGALIGCGCWFCGGAIAAIVASLFFISVRICARN